MNAPGAKRWQRLAGNRNLQVGLAMLAALLLAGAFGPWLVRWDPIEIDFAAALQRPGAAHPFGTDELGRDVLARVLAATFVDLKVVAVCVVLPFFIGSLIGLASGYYGGWFDRALMRLVDILLAFPHYVLVIAIVGSLGPGIANLYLAFALVVWISFARIVRAEVLVARRAEYAQAARLLGYGHARVMLRHILPNVITPAIIFMMSDVVLTILAVTSLGFLGLGIQPPTPAWGNMLGEGRVYMLNSWWIATFPGLAIFVTTLVINLMGNALRDWLDPHLKL